MEPNPSSSSVSARPQIVCINLKHPGHEWALLVSPLQTIHLLLAVLELNPKQVVEIMLVNVVGEKEEVRLVDALFCSTTECSG